MSDCTARWEGNKQIGECTCPDVAPPTEGNYPRKPSESHEFDMTVEDLEAEALADGQYGGSD